MIRFSICSFVERAWVEGHAEGRNFWSLGLAGDRDSGPLRVKMVAPRETATTRRIGKRLPGSMMLFKGVMLDTGELMVQSARPAEGLLPYIRLDGDGTVTSVNPFYGSHRLVVAADEGLHVGLIWPERLTAGTVIAFSASLRRGNLVAGKVEVRRRPRPRLDFGANREIAASIDDRLIRQGGAACAA